MRRALLLVPPLENLIDEDLIHLSADASPNEILGQGPCFSKIYRPGMTIYWSQSHLPLNNNAIISKLIGGVIVTGDAIVEIDTDILPLQAAYGHLIPNHHRINNNNTAVDHPHTSLQQHQWCHMPSEILSRIISLSGDAAITTAAAMSQVCHSWRYSLIQERCLWQSLTFHTLSCKPRGQTHANCTTILNRIRTSNTKQDILLPYIVRQAIEAGNISAAVVAARFYEKAGDVDQARKNWMRAGRLGHPEAQWKIGFGYYNAELGLHLDSEESALWLTRAAKTLIHALSSSSSSIEQQQQQQSNNSNTSDDTSAVIDNGTDATMDSSNTSNNASVSVASEGDDDDDANSDTVQQSSSSYSSLPLLMSESMCRFALSQSAHILGVIHLDGDSAKQDLAVAIKWFQIAQDNGCLEAGRILQSLFRSGQYG